MTPTPHATGRHHYAGIFLLCLGTLLLDLSHTEITAAQECSIRNPSPPP